MEREKQIGPLPYIISNSWTGQLKIGWTTELVPYEAPSIIPEEKIAIEEVYFLAKQQESL